VQGGQSFRHTKSGTTVLPQDVPVLVYEIEGDICDGVGESLIASGTARFHFSDKHLTNGRVIQNSGVQGTVDLVAGGQALLVVRSPFYAR
jgi:hypothetical protein